MTNGIRQPPSNEILSQVLGLINRIAELVATGDYIFRGEPKFFDKVSSSLYRQHEVVIDEDNPIISIQDGILEEARKYTDETDDLTILSELQHFGGKTNLIDFTSDYLIALFFACDGFPLQDGRLILLDKRGSMDPHIIERHPHNTRAVFQKSVFVMPPLGYIEPDEIVKIPADLKLPLTDYLRRSHSISKETIYNDLFGFIRQQELHGEAYEELYLARKFHSEDEADFQHAVDHYTRAISLYPRLDHAFCGRGGAYLSKGENDLAIHDFCRALELDENHSCAYANRGRAYSNQEDYVRAVVDFSKAIQLNQDFKNSTTSIAHFQRGTAYLHLDKLDLAIRDFDVVIERDLPPNLLSAHHNRGAAYFYKGEFARAIQDFEQCLALGSNNSDTFCLRGTALAYEGHYYSAIKSFDKSLELDDGHSCGYQNRGVTRLFVSEWEAAKRDLLTAKSMGSDLVAPFREDFGSVAEFEEANGVNIPVDIATLLGE